VPVPPLGTAFTCTPVAIWDGDGPIWCREGPRIRLQDINARELDGSCRRHARCVATSGLAARAVLARLLGGARGIDRKHHVRVVGPPLSCRSGGPDRYHRTLARCVGPAGDVAEQLVRAGAVARWRL
jgi:endonuclease YncB( thermonuclease family)